MDLVGFAKSVGKDILTELRKWARGSTTLELGNWKRCVTHLQGVVIFAVFIVIMGGMFSYQAGAIRAGTAGEAPASGGGGGKPVSYDGWTAQAGSSGATGTAAEAEPGTTERLTLGDKNLVSVEFKLKWTDETDHDRLHQNEPDELGVSVVTPWGAEKTASAKNPQGGEGSVTVSFEVVQTRFDGTNGSGDWNFTVFCKDAGDHMPKRVGVLKWIDGGNAYTLDINWTYYSRPGK